MKYIKTFEDNTNIPKIGDYVSIISKKYINHIQQLYGEKNINELKDFFLNSPGQIYTIYNNDKIQVKYDITIPKNIKKFFLYDSHYGYNLKFYSDEINEFAKTIDELKYKVELKNSTNKFNL